MTRMHLTVTALFALLVLLVAGAAPWRTASAGVVDTTKPTASLSIPAFTSTLTVAVTLAGTDANGISGYFLSTSPTIPAAADPGWLATAPTTFTLPEGPDGNRTLYGWTKDPAGNVSAPASDTAFVDTVAPVVRFAIFNRLRSFGGFSGFALDPRPSSGLALGRFSLVQQSGDDCAWWDPGKQELIPGPCFSPLWFALSGTRRGARVFWSKRTGWLESAGTYTLAVEFTDKAGNTGAHSGTFRLDPTPPTVSLSIPPFTRTLTVPVTLSGTDNIRITGYGVSTNPGAPSRWQRTKPTSFTFRAAPDGTLTLYAWTRDATGNVSETASATTVLDRQTPLVGIDFPTFDAKLVELKKIAGSATDPGPTPGAGLVSGQFAIQQKTGTSCRWWNPNQGKLVAGPCSKPLFFALPVTKAWSKAIGTLDDAGAYTLMVEFTDKAGNVGKATRKFSIAASGGADGRGFGS